MSLVFLMAHPNARVMHMHAHFFTRFIFYPLLIPEGVFNLDFR